MYFRVEKEIFDKLPIACFGVVMARGIDNSKAYPEIERLLTESIQTAALHFEGKKVKEEVEILPYREAFRTLGINPNKYLCSIEALFTRIAKGNAILIKAQTELNGLLKNIFRCETKLGFVDSNNREMKV